MKKLFLFLAFLFLSATSSMAATYYASPSGGGAASCVDNGANVCTLARAVVVAGTGTNTIESATGTYSITTELSLGSGNTGANLTFTCAGAVGTCIWGSSGTEAVVDIESAMVSGTVTFNGIEITDNGADYSIRNQAPEVNVIFTGGTINNTDSSVGTGIYFPVDTTNLLTLISGEDTTTDLRIGATTNTKIAQKILVGGSDIVVNRASFKLRRRCGNKGSNCDMYKSGESWDYRTADTLTVTIETDSAGAPSGTPVTNGTSQTIRPSSVPWRADTGGEWSFFTFSSNVTLTAATNYWVVITGNYTTSSTNYIEVATDTGNGYANGDSATFNATSWTGAAAGTDLLFTIDRAATRNLTVTSSTFSSRANCITLGWADTVTIDSNTLTSTAGNVMSISANNQWTTSDLQFKKVVFSNNTVSATADGLNLIVVGVSGFAKTYVDVLIIKGNTGVVSRIINPVSYVKKLYFVNNDLEVQYAGNTPFSLGNEPDGIDPAGYNYRPFSQILIEGNTLYYSSATHNHMLLIALGAEDGILRNNTLYAYNSGSGGRAWGIVLKATGWLVNGNSVFGVSPAIAVYGTNHSNIINNTFECFGSGSDGCVLLRNHQDSIYGPTTYGKGFYNYIKDNIIISDDAFSALDYGTTTTDPYDPTARDSQYWSNIVDNNIYYAKTNTNTIDFENPSVQEYITYAEGISTLQNTWASSSYTHKSSLSIYNDISNSVFTLPSFTSASTGDFTTTSSSAINKGTISGTSIGSYQITGGGGANTKMGLSL